MVGAARFKVKSFKASPVFLKPTTLSFRTSDRVAVLAHDDIVLNGLIRILCRSLPLDEGQITCDAFLSPPIGGMTSTNPALTGLEGVKFAARLYGVDEMQLFGSVQALTEGGDALYQKLRDMPPALRAQFNHALWLCIRFDTYLFQQNVVVGADKGYKDRCQWLLDEVMDRVGFILFTKRPKTALEFCDYGFVYQEGSLIPFQNMKMATDFFQSSDLAP